MEQLIRDMDAKIRKNKERAEAESRPKVLKLDDQRRLDDIKMRQAGAYAYIHHLAGWMLHWHMIDGLACGIAEEAVAWCVCDMLCAVEWRAWLQSPAASLQFRVSCACTRAAVTGSSAVNAYAALLLLLSCRDGGACGSAG
jgi:hypothetical protein